MKVLAIAFICINVLAQNIDKIQESIYVESTDTKLVELISNQPHLTIDHPDRFGFELYGPRGTMQWLENLGVSFKNKHQSYKSLSSVGYPSYQEMTASLKSMANAYPHISKLFSIGKSVKGKELWVLKISDNPGVDEVEPEFKYISSMHGDEITGRELTQFLIKDLLEGYDSDAKIKALVDNTEIFIMPSMNPDGSEAGVRWNANFVDLNRNFPDWTAGHPNTATGREPEVQAIMDFQNKRNFSLSANFHGGAVCVNYPWDSAYERHPLNDLLIDLSHSYADHNPEMVSSTEFTDGITNGADWYVLKGGMQDWSYIWYNDLQLTVELSDAKWPRYSEIPSYYEKNKESMFTYLKAIHRGAGFKLASNVDGEVQIFDLNSNKDLGSFDFKNGEFYKVLPSGHYKFIVDTSLLRREFSLEVQENEIQNNGNYYRE